MGALCATVVGVYVPGLPGACHILLALAAGVLAWHSAKLLKRRQSA